MHKHITLQVIAYSRNSLAFIYKKSLDSRPPAPKAGTLTGLCYTPKSDAKVQLFSDNLNI